MGEVWRHVKGADKVMSIPNVHWKILIKEILDLF